MRTAIHRLMLVAITILLAIPVSALSDKITLKDGTVIEGRVINKNAQLITIEVIENGKTKEKIIIADKVAMIEDGDVAEAPADPAKPATPAKVKTGPTYGIVPIRKTFGLETQAALVKQMLEESAKSDPDFIIIDIDSPGGLVSEMLDVMDVLAQWQQTQKTPLIAYVRKEALSAAALTAMSVKQIYMSPTSTMGAAMIISVDSTGGVRAVDSTRAGEKFSSAIRAKARSYTEAAGHNPVIVDAMIDPDLGLSIAEDKDGKTVVLAGPPNRHKAADYKSPPVAALQPGKLLTLTTAEATKFGVIKGVAKDVDELGTLLGKAGWQPASDAGTKIFDRHVKAIENANSEYDKAIQRIKDADTMIARADGRNLSVYENSANAARASVMKIDKLAKDYPFIAQRAAIDFPQGTDRFRLMIDTFIGRINAAKRARVK